MVKKTAAATDAAGIDGGAEGSQGSVARSPAASTALAPLGSGEMFLRMPRELTPPVYGMMRDMAHDLAGSGMLPAAIRSPGAAFAIMLKAHELGIPPMQGFAHIHIVKGKPTLSAELMLALIYRAFPRATITYPQNNTEGCIIEAARPGGQPQRFGFSIEDARRAQLVPAKPDAAWTTYPRAMCRSRAISEMARSLFPDVLMGCSYTPEELGAAVSVNAEGHLEVIDVVASPAKDAPPPPTAIQAAVAAVEKAPPVHQGEARQAAGDIVFSKDHAPHREWLRKMLNKRPETAMLVDADRDAIALKLDGFPCKALGDAYEEWLKERDEPADVLLPEEAGLGKPLAPGERPTA